ncbi:hypothetical protein JB92DRAFT_3132040 [Gautieria morchelliformis]|nr:hypothetical protein JB92DRAFT_3132040 [Gautieria morchelliformis]
MILEQKDPVSDDDIEADLPSLVDFINSRPAAPSITITTPSQANVPSILLTPPVPDVATNPALPSSAAALPPMADAPRQRLQTRSRPKALGIIAHPPTPRR